MLAVYIFHSWRTLDQGSSKPHCPSDDGLPPFGTVVVLDSAMEIGTINPGCSPIWELLLILELVGDKHRLKVRERLRHSIVKSVASVTLLRVVRTKVKFQNPLALSRRRLRL